MSFSSSTTINSSQLSNLFYCLLTLSFSFLFWGYKNSCFSWLKPLIYGIDYEELEFSHAISSNSMDDLPGAFGTSASLALRFGQTIFSLASIFFMCLDVGFFAYTSFCFLVTVMGLVIPWSITLIVVDAYSVFIRYLPRQPKILLVIIVGDLVLSFLLLGAASSTASVTNVLLAADGYCTAKPCSRYQLSAAMAFFSWFLSLASSLFNLWLLPSL